MNYLGDFERRHLRVTQKLSRLIGYDIAAYPTRQIWKMLNHSMFYYRNGNQICWIELAKARLLVAQLEIVKENNVDAFRDFKKRLKTLSGSPEYIGLRAEIYLAAHMARRGVQFRKRESPDFEIPLGDDNVFIECGSVHSSKERAGSDVYKVGAAVRNKAAKHYARRDTALFLDVNHVVFTSSIKNIQLEEINQEAMRELEPSGFGSLVASWYVTNPETDRYELRYSRWDSADISPLLTSLLDDTFSRGAQGEAEQLIVTPIS